MDIQHLLTYFQPLLFAVNMNYPRIPLAVAPLNIYIYIFSLLWAKRIV